MSERKVRPFVNNAGEVLNAAIKVMNLVDPIGAGPGWSHRALRLLSDPDIAKALDDGLSAARHDYDRKTKAAYETISTAMKEQEKQIDNLLADIAAMYRARPSPTEGTEGE